ncbi:transcription factor domain-containing protein [Aspergillus mulundensis]|uniref:Zn(2)-C6 fungal-type domain-containing protein n=1 Tax=Aspergillus mulundensis TaxID=1810919 RepID=A0A3D8QH09_9EURO|nr:Uncharacterized protein DSM5745_10621 [Aspergillus mulundensis]RDW61123.1 Uncharacterized protein DSM5745_10621 [Aspergillus mulundensis]
MPPTRTSSTSQQSPSICFNCHKKQLKCNLGRKTPCSNCAKDSAKCVPYNRKRKDAPDRDDPKARRDSKDGGRKDKDKGKDRDKSKDKGKDDGHKKRKEGGSLARDLDAIVRIDPIDTTRGRYLGRSVNFDEPMQTPVLAKENPLISAADLQLLREQDAFTLPTNQVQHELITTFLEYGHTWTPIIDPAWLTGSAPSFLLLQALFVAASRMSPQPNDYGPPEDFYRRAKLLFFFGIERDPLIQLSSALLLHWYNPVGANTLVTDTSAFWLRTAESIAFQVGLHKEPDGGDRQKSLRRRLWWTMVLRDCITSAETGRPRTLNLSDSDIFPPSIDDFPEPDAEARIFPASVAISQRLGETVELCLRNELTAEHKRSLEDSLFRWAKQDFPSVAGPFPGYSMEARQVAIAYLANLIILDRAALDGLLSARSVLAGSFIVGIFREFLQSDYLCRLGSGFAFYASCAGLILIPAGRIDNAVLQELIGEEILMLKAALHILSRQWGTASDSLRTLRSVGKAKHGKRLHLDLSRMDETRAFFEPFDKTWCRLWAPLVENDGSQHVSRRRVEKQKSVLEPYAIAQANAWDIPPVPVEYPDPPSKGSGSGCADLGGAWLLRSAQAHAHSHSHSHSHSQSQSHPQSQSGGSRDRGHASSGSGRGSGAPLPGSERRG